MAHKLQEFILKYTVCKTTDEEKTNKERVGRHEELRRICSDMKTITEKVKEDIGKYGRVQAAIDDRHVASCCTYKRKLKIHI